MTTFARSRQTDLPQMELELTPSAEGFRARTYPRPVEDLGWTASDLACGESLPVSFANYDPATCSWRTAQSCLMDGLEKFSGRWSRSGLISNGTAYRLPPLAPLTDVTAFGLLPTPLASDNRDRGNVSMPSVQRRFRIGKQVGLSMLFKREPCPLCVEGMMGFPTIWTEV